MSKSQVLGKGLKALIGEENLTLTSPNNKGQIDLPNNEIEISRLKAGEYQPRKEFDENSLIELAESIKRNGVILPLIVREITGSKNYQIIAGERRFRASKIAGLKTIPVIVKKLSDTEALETALIENIQREDLTIIEEAEGYQRLIEDFKYTQEDLSKRVGKSRSHVANLLRILSLPEDVKKHVNSGSISMGHARALIGSQNSSEIAKEIIDKGLNVRKTEELLRELNGKIKSSKSNSYKSSISNDRDEDLVMLESTLSENLGLKVTIEDSRNGGFVKIEFNNLEQLDEIIKRLG